MLRALMPLALIAAPVAAAPFASERISVTVEGKGPDVLLVPGLSSSPAAWGTVTPLVPGHRYHLVQVKGFAGTPVAGNAAGPLLPALADELARYARAQRIRPAVVGHSMGGTVAIMLAARHPDTVSRVMVVDMVPFTGVFYGGPGATAASVRPTAEAGERRMAAASEADWRAQVTAMTGGMVANVEKRPLVVGQALASDRALVARTFAELMTTDLRPELPRIAVPTRVLYVTPAGVPVTDAQIDALYRTAYAGLKGAELIRVPASAHFVMFDNPAFFAAELKRFLAAG